MFAPPTFVERFDVQPPVYIRKIDSRARWEIEGNNVKERAQKVADSLFKSEVSSIWLVKSESILERCKCQEAGNAQV